MDIMAIREALVETLLPVLPGWEGYPILVDSFSPPAFMVCDISDVDYLRAMNEGSFKFTISVRYCVPRASDVDAHRILSEVIQTGPGTPAQALNDSGNLNGTCMYATLVRARRTMRFMMSSSETYLGCEQEIEIEG